jgi:hypothetical protein
MTDQLTTALDQLTTAVAALIRAAMTVEAELAAAAPDPDADAVSAVVDRIGDLTSIAPRMVERIALDVRRTVAEVRA